MRHNKGNDGDRPNACRDLYGETVGDLTAVFVLPVSPQRENSGGRSRRSPDAYAANLSAKKMTNWLYAIPQSRTGIVHFFVISFAERKTTFFIESSVGKIAFALVNFLTIR